MIDDIDARDLDSTQGPSADPDNPGEPFACPACGQMLAPTCRVCVACKQPVNPAQIGRLEAVAPRTEPAAVAPRLARVPFPWVILLLVFTIWLFTASVAVRLLGPVHSQFAMGGLVILTSTWVFYDARARRVPKPLRWGIGCLLLWIVFFPWYLARRRTPEAVCPFVEAERGPLLRVLLIALFVFFFLSVVLALLKGPPPQ
jgi:hypothetical protein